MVVVTGHMNTDMDSLASTLLAAKLHPGSVMVFPGTLNKNVRDFVSLHKDALPIYRLSEISFEQVERIIIVDTCQAQRIGSLKDLLERDDIEIAIYDHHVNQPGNIRGHQMVLEPVGATTTLLIEEIRKQGIALTSFEATVAALGIYEDTGRFTFDSTTVRDTQALTFLLSSGAQLQVVCEFIGWSITEMQRGLLAALLTGAEIVNAHGVRYIVAKAATADFVEDMALITHRLGELYDTDAAISVVRMGNHIYYVGRSYSSDINVGLMARTLGGGGHARAASAVIKNEPLDAVYEKVLKLCAEEQGVLCIAGEIMTTPVKTVAPAITMKEAGDILARCGHSGLPVVDKQALVGMISRRDIEKALHKKLGHVPVKGFMRKPVITVEPSTPVRDLQKLMIEHDIGRLPVVDKDALVGIISRSDILQVLHGAKFNKPYRTLYSVSEPCRLSADMIADLLRRKTGRYELLQEAGQIAWEMGMHTAAVGGFVRDLLLGLENEDLDLTVEGDGLALAQELARRWGAEIKMYKAFGTAMLLLSDGRKIDIATARTEYYEFPAVLPTVQFGSLRQDLGRRDFTVNAMAINLIPGQFAEILDFFGGYADLQNGLIRVLYSQSFSDDPTRLFRAVRFEQRYGFRLETQTEQLLRNEIAGLAWRKLSDEQISRELLLIFKESRCQRILKRLDKLELWLALFPDVPFDNFLTERLRRVQQVRFSIEKYMEITAPWLIILMLLLYRLEPERRLFYLDLLKLTVRQRDKILEGLNNFAEIVCQLQKGALKKAEIFDLLKGLSSEGIVFIATLLSHHKLAARRIETYISDLQRIKPLLNGDDIRKLGIENGPVIGQLLRSVHREKLNGCLATKQDELQFVQTLIKRGGEF